MTTNSILIRILILVVLLTSTRVFAQGINDCEFYREQSLAMGCSKGDYLIKFGYKYCKKFQAIQNQFTPAGLKTLDAIRNCLINELDQTPGLLCSNMKSVALQSHVKCYVKVGYCSMEKRDRNLIARTVWRELIDPEFASVSFQIESACNKRRVN